MTNPEPSNLKIKKRIVVCCDGTWQDGIVMNQRWKYTNILRLSRAINHVDERFFPPKPQIVFYQSGVGSEPSRYYALLDGDKVQEAYAFIAHNYEPGDEICLFGFSRGAYTARMVAMMIGQIGVLDRTDMDHFADIFIDYQTRGRAKTEIERQALDKKLEPWTQRNSPGKIRADSDGDTFSIKCLGVFDTVGSLGLPEELTLRSKNLRTLFGFPDSVLGTHIERAYQALALNETRADFNCNKFQQTKEGAAKGQVLKQCWFAGSHSDASFQEHDLSDLTLTWMAAQVGDVLSLDVKYIFSLLKPVAPWGAQEPHDSETGIFALADTIRRQLPTHLDPVTHEMIHPSVLKQDTVLPQLQFILKDHPDLVAKLLPLEEEVKVNWNFVPAIPGHPSTPNTHGNKTAKVEAETSKADVGRRRSLLVRAMDSVTRRTRSDSSSTLKSPKVRSPPMVKRASSPAERDQQGWLLKVAAQDSSFGALVREFMERA
ncbi:hypothetical protein BV25DRAFT_1793249 [Artomyces pyxidatus]|uniref:Uncharacterized protein n=1 Tax=Artomyces pyxidatus TaxID=48021 RepID=A0ACB8TIL9_9AGAM|nr:hypothetical protein BV25DRAFT_1793249 [Artomyces pyxidatus]